MERKKKNSQLYTKKSRTVKNRSQGHVPNHLQQILPIRKKINQLETKSKHRLYLNLEREFILHYSLKYLCDVYGTKIINQWYWTPNFIRNGLPEANEIVPNFENPIETIEFKRHIEAIHESLESANNLHHLINKEELNFFVEQVEKVTNTIIEKYPSLKNISELERYALFRYHVIGALSNISLSVSPETKREWNIDFELFGAFYNTNYNYCGLFPELEKRCCCDVFHFDLKPNMTILVNPPYTEQWIEKSCELVNQYLEQNMNTTIWLVLPVWNKSDRKRLKLPIQYNDMPILDTMKQSTYIVSHEIVELDFYNGLEKKNVKLKDKVHVYHLSNSK